MKSKSFTSNESSGSLLTTHMSSLKLCSYYAHSKVYCHNKWTWLCASQTEYISFFKKYKLHVIIKIGFAKHYKLTALIFAYNAYNKKKKQNKHFKTQIYVMFDSIIFEQIFMHIFFILN